MNPIERMLFTFKVKFQNLPLVVKVLPIILILIGIGCSILFKSGILDTVGMSEEEKAAYTQQKELEAEKIAEEEAAAALVAAEIEHGYRMLDSPNLTDEEQVVADFVHACKTNDYATVAKNLDVPNIFSEENLSIWVQEIGLVPYIASEDDATAIITVDQDVLNDDDKVIGTEHVCKIFNQETQEDPFVFVVDTNNGNVRLTPRKGILNDVEYVFQVRSVFCNGEDLSNYYISTVSSPISSGNESKGESSNLWYQFSFSRFPDIQHPEFMIDTSLGMFATTPATTSFSKNENVMISDFTSAEVQMFSDAVRDTIWNAIQAIQQEAPDEQIATYMAVSDVIKTVSPSNEEVREKTFESISSVTGVEVYMNEVVSGDIPAIYNYHLAGDNTISARVNVRYIMGSGECRRTTTLLLRKYENNWTIVAMNNNIFNNINVLDPEW